MTTETTPFTDQPNLATVLDTTPGTVHVWRYDDAGQARGPLDLEEALNSALTCGRYLVAVWRVADGKVHLYREIDGFPAADLSIALELLANDVQPLMSATSAFNDAPLSVANEVPL
jgi:hypothetical protein